MRDRAILGILASNLLTAVVALWQDWPLLVLLGPYWLQSVVIGWYSRRRILALPRFSTEGFTVNGRQPPATEQTKRSTANFFALHYGGFHLAYLVFMLAAGLGTEQGGTVALRDLGLILILGVGFAFSHRYSHRLNLEADLRGERNIGALMFLPYARVLPMHVMIILGVALGKGAAMLLLFTVLKTAADVLMHVIEHRWLRGGPAASG